MLILKMCLAIVLHESCHELLSKVCSCNEITHPSQILAGLNLVQSTMMHAQQMQAKCQIV